MAGVPGAGGPPPKRSDQRRRRNKTEPVTSAAGGSVVVPESDPGWHPVAVRWFEGLKVSGQSVFYEQSDWVTAFLVAESISRELKPQPLRVGDEVVWVEQPPKGTSLQGWLKAMSSLLVTEGDRRRVRLELDPAGVVDADGEAAVVRLADIRDRFEPKSEVGDAAGGSA